MAVSPDGARIAVIGETGPVQLLDAHTGNPLRSFDVERQEGVRTVLAFSPDGAFLVLGCGPQACVLDAASGRLVTRLPSDAAAHGGMVWAASFSPDGKDLAMASYHSGDVLVYDVATWQTAATVPGDTDTVFSVTFSPGGEWLATGGREALKLWRVGHYEVPAAEARNTGIVWAAAFPPDDTGLVTAGDRLQAWRIVPGEVSTSRLEPGQSKRIRAHTVMPVSWGGRACFTAAAPDAVHLFCGASLDEELRIPVTSSAAAISPDGRRLFNEQNDGVLGAFALHAGAETIRLPLGSPVRALATADRGWLAAGTEGGEVAIVGVEPVKERRRLQLEAPVEKLAVSSDGRWLAAVQGPSLRVFDAGSWRQVLSTKFGDEEAVSAGFAGDRWLVAAAGAAVVVWEPGGWRERHRLKHDGRVEALHAGPDGRQLATVTHWRAGRDSGVELMRVFDLTSGNEMGWEYTSGGSYASKRFMEEEAARRQRALAGGNTALVRQASSWPKLGVEDRVSADGVLGVGYSQSVASLLDIAADRVIGNFDHGDAITAVRYVPSRAPRWLVTGGKDGTLAFWPLRTDDLVRETCARLQAIFEPNALAKLMADAGAGGSCEAKPR